MARPLERSVDAILVSQRSNFVDRGCALCGGSPRGTARWRSGGGAGARDALRRRGSLDHVSQPEGCRGSAKQQPSPPSPSRIRCGLVVAWVVADAADLHSWRPDVWMSLRTYAEGVHSLGQPVGAMRDHIRSSPFVRTNRQGTQPRRQGVTPGAGGWESPKTVPFYKKTDTSGALDSEFFQPR